MAKTKAVALKVVAAVFLSGLIFFSLSNNNSQFYCREQDRVLVDSELIEAALNLELKKEREGYRYDAPLPPGYEIANIDDQLLANPDCCGVLRGMEFRDVPDNWFDRWLYGSRVQIRILLDAKPPSGRRLALEYFTDQCGNENGDRSFGLLPS